MLRGRCCNRSPVRAVASGCHSGPAPRACLADGSLCPASVAVFALSNHAATAAKERGIHLSWIERTLVSPTRTARDGRDARLLHAFRPIRERDGRVLRVVYDPSVQPWRVVTVFFDRKEKRGG